MNIEGKVKEIIKPVIDEMHLLLDEVQYEKEGNEYYLRIFIEKENDLIDLDMCVEASEKISLLLDKYDPIPQEYYLEVASSGKEKELVNKEDYCNALNKYLLVNTEELINNYNELTGYLKEVKEDEIRLEVNFKGKIKIVSIPFKIIRKAQLTYKI